MPRLQHRLMLALAALVVLTVSASGWFAERGLHRREGERLERALLQDAALTRELVRDVPFTRAASAELKALADRAARASGARVTLIDAAGTVLADSDVPLANLDRVENHAGRPEVRSALAGQRGHASRRSETVSRRLFYMAVPLVPGQGAGVVRLAVDMDDVDAAVAELRRVLLFAGCLGLLGALVVAYAVSRLTVRPLIEMREALAAIADGDLERRLPVHDRDEIGRMAEAVNSVGRQLGSRLAEVTAEKDQLQAVLAGMVEGVLVLDQHGRIVLANPRLRELLGIWNTVEGRRVLEVVRHPGIDEALRRASEDAGPVVSEIELTSPTEQTLLLHAARFPADGPPAGIVAVFHDVTEVRRLAHVRREFVANASHELQTPLTAIRGFAETLIGGSPSEDETRSYVQVILRNAERLQHLIEDLLTLSRIESRKLPLQLGEVNVARLADTLLRDLEPRLKERRIDAHVEDQGAGPAWADRRAVEQILTNLLDNALKYTEPGGRVTLRVGARADSVRVRVQDTGVGIPQADQARVFERFYRVDKARSRALGGTGLGLSIVKNLLQAMGGDIFVESTPDEGTTFTFTLPRPDRSDPI